jgi:hypothetical protein
VVQNLEGSTRETELRTYRGWLPAQGKAYDFFTYRFTHPDEVKNVFRRTDTVAIEQPILRMNWWIRCLCMCCRRKINQAAVLEEWRMDKNTLAFEKKVVGICLWLLSFTETGELKDTSHCFCCSSTNSNPDVLKESNAQE